MSRQVSNAPPATETTKSWIERYDSSVPESLSPSFSSPLAAFEACLARNPDTTALWYFQSPLTYRELDDEARRLQAHWAGHVAAGARVAVMNQNTPATLAALIAAWRLGAMVMPLSPMLTDWELTHYLSDGEPSAALLGFAQAPAFIKAAGEWGRPLSIVVSQASDYLLPLDKPTLLVNSTGASGEAPPGAQWLSSLRLHHPSTASASLGSSDIALLTYTSGTTGKPKAACNTHGNVCFSAEVFKVWLRLGREDILLAAAPFSHITGLVAHIATAWLADIPLVMAYRFDAATMLSLIERHGCTSTVAAITAYIAMLDHPQFAAPRVKTFTKLFSGGAPVSSSVVNRWEAATGIYIHNAYGLTETTSATHMVPFGQRAPIDPASGVLSVGVPVPNTHCRVVGADGTLSGEAVGELEMQGPQIACGYWRNEKETHESFHDGWLKTGDLGRVDAAGWFYLVDRAKDVIVASGFKVWPRELELALESHPAIKEAAVVGVPDAYRGETPKAFVVLREGAAASEALLRAYCRERLSPDKVPRFIEFVESLPRNHAGKLLRRQFRDRPHE